LSIRVPTPVVSLSDVTALLKRSVSVEEVNEVFKKAAAEPYYQGILDVTEEELVSSDFIGNSHSTIVDLKLTNVVGGNLLKVVAWYDNEWGYANRLVEVTADVGKLLQGGDLGAQPPAGQSDQSGQPASEGPQPEQPAEQAAAPQSEPMLEAPAEANEELLAPPASAVPSTTEQFAPAPPPAPEVPAEPVSSATEQSSPSAETTPPPMTNTGGSIDGFNRMQ